MTRSTGRKAAPDSDEFASREGNDQHVVNNVVDLDPKNYGHTMRSLQKDGWMKAMAEEFFFLGERGLPRCEDAAWRARNWIYKSKRDAGAD